MMYNNTNMNVVYIFYNIRYFDIIIWLSDIVLYIYVLIELSINHFNYNFNLFFVCLLFKDCAQLKTVAYVHGLPKPVEIGESSLQLDHSNI